jgi:hypothetical protein
VPSMVSVTSQGINGEEETVVVMILNVVSERTCGSARGRAGSERWARGAWLDRGASGAVDAGRHRMARGRERRREIGRERREIGERIREESEWVRERKPAAATVSAGRGSRRLRE